MSGLCACTRCNVERRARDATPKMVPLAWQALDRDPVCQKLAAAVSSSALDPATRATFGAWLESQGVMLEADTQSAVAQRYTNADPID
jgi:hypothetical protein